MNDLIKKLENIQGCMIGSRTDNYTPLQQIEKLIEELKQPKTASKKREL